jgi:hypothetical protein
LAQVVRRPALDTAARGGDKALDGGGVVASGEFLFLGLLALEDGDGEEVVVDRRVQVEDLEDLLVGLGAREEGSVALLPQELARAEEGL